MQTVRQSKSFVPFLWYSNVGKQDKNSFSTYRAELNNDLKMCVNTKGV